MQVSIFTNISILKMTLTEILPPAFNVGGLYLGDLKSASHVQTLQNFKIHRVISIIHDRKIYIPCVNWNYFHIRDNWFTNIRKILPYTNNLILKDLLQGHNVLVHCRMGKSRSAAIVIAFLQSIGVTNSYQFVKNKRPMIRPNLSFRLQLLL